MSIRERLEGEDPEAGADAEIRFHLEQRVKALVAAGLSPEAARAEALRRFGDPEVTRRKVVREDRKARRRQGISAALGALAQDLRYALRRLRSDPGFSVVAILTVALTLGATTSVFSVVDGIILRPLPFAEPHELVAVWADVTERGGPEREWHSYPNLHDLRQESRSLEALGWYLNSSTTLAEQGDLPEQIPVALVDRALLDGVLQVTPAAGRLFLPEEDTPGGPDVVLLSHGLWTERFGADPALVGETIRLDGRATTVVGILAEDFLPPFAPGARMWRPLQQDAGEHFGGRASFTYRAIGRLADGVTLDEARLELDQIGARLEQAYPEANTDQGFSAFPLLEDLTAGTRTGLLVLLGAVAMMLLIGCVNVATLLLARSSAREGELAVRTALGGGRRRILGQLLTEHLVLAAVGGLLGVFLAIGGTRLLVSLAPPGTPRVTEIGVDGRVLAFAGLATLAAGLLFGLLPAFRGASSPATPLRQQGRSGGAHREGTRLRGVLVVAQVALALVLLVGSGLLLRSFDNLRRADLGFDPAGVLTFQVVLPPDRYPDRAALTTALADLHDRLGSLPGVEAAGLVSILPLSGGGTDSDFFMEGRPLPPPGQAPVTWLRQASHGYMESLGMDPVRGRALQPADLDGPRVLVVNETFARLWYPGEEVLGKRINLGDPESPTWWEVVGVVPDQRGYGLREDGIRSEILLPIQQAPSRGVTATLRVERGDPAALAPTVREAVAAFDPALAVAGLQPMTDYVGDALAQDRFVTLLLTLFAVVALLLASVGLYGVVSRGVAERRQEMGVRLAMGARPGSLRTLVLRRSLGLVGVGVALGILGALGVTRALGGLLFGIEPMDPLTFLLVAGVLAGVATAATLIPAARAARTDPATVLRGD